MITTNTPVAPESPDLLLGYHGSPGARAALSRATDLVERGGRLTVVYVDDLGWTSLAWAGSSQGVMPVDGREVGERILLDALECVPRGLPTTWVVRRGGVARQLARVAHDLGCSAIMLGAPANRPMRLRPLRSISRQLDRLTGLPILEVHQHGSPTSTTGPTLAASTIWN
jgi:nucleotide-binding universal stress UspA family protein